VQSLIPIVHSRPPAPVGARRWRRHLLGAPCLAALGLMLGPPLPTFGQTVPVAGIPALKRTDDGTLKRRKPGRVVVELDRTLERITRNAPDIVVRSFGTWLDAAPALPDVAFVHSNRTNPGARRDGTNTVSFAPIEIEGHGRDLAITVTYSDERTGEILEADIVLNSRHELELLDDEGPLPHDSCRGADERCHAEYDLESIVTHEVGHFWGLGEDHEERQATMFLCTSRCEIHKRTLETSDIAGLDRLYPSGTVTTSQAPGCGSRSSTTTRWADD
jgi:hypothetical protein